MRRPRILRPRTFPPWLRFRVHDLQVNGFRKRNADGFVVVEFYLDLEVGEQIRFDVLDQILVDKSLFVGLAVHETISGSYPRFHLRGPISGKNQEVEARRGVLRENSYFRLIYRNARIVYA